ncbi:MAG TPA: DUF4097 family beta strand repeat-containing protein [Gemmatimonadaceae bacterium]|nr:DUF4097 family beta strand repeat-containing protein [Gemmatimonadaceae bacterium]
MRRTASHTLLAAALAFVPSLLAAQQVQGVKDRSFTASERVAAGGAVRIFARQGDITITEGAGSTVEFRADKDDRRGRLDEIGFIVRKDGDGVTICAVYAEDDDCDADGLDRQSWRRNWGRRSLRLAMTVKVPRGTLVRATSGNGDVSLAASVAEAHVSSGNGKVRVSGVSGRVDASSGNGEVSVDNATGPVAARSGNGDVTIGTVNGPVNASSGNGDIRVRMEKLTGSDDMEFSSGNGRVEVVVPSDFSAEVDANSGNGRITTDFPITIRGKLSPSRLRGTIGNGGRRLRMSTGNGSMEIRRAG